MKEMGGKEDVKERKKTNFLFIINPEMTDAAIPIKVLGHILQWLFLHWHGVDLARRLLTIQKVRLTVCLRLCCRLVKLHWNNLSFF